MADPPSDGRSRKPENQRSPPRENPDDKGRFAKAMAKAEFGRFYWSDQAERALREAMKRKPKR